MLDSMSETRGPQEGSDRSAGSNPETQTTSQIIAHHDPIDIQRFYLDIELRRQPWEDYGVKGFRIYQRLGEGVHPCRVRIRCVV